MQGRYVAFMRAAWSCCFRDRHQPQPPSGSNAANLILKDGFQGLRLEVCWENRLVLTAWYHGNFNQISHVFLSVLALWKCVVWRLPKCSRSWAGYLQGTCGQPGMPKVGVPKPPSCDGLVSYVGQPHVQATHRTKEVPSGFGICWIDFSVIFSYRDPPSINLAQQPPPTTFSCQ